MDYLNIGSTPTDEPCAQIDSPNCSILSHIEARVFINQLYRQFPTSDIHLKVKTFAHDFGNYIEVIVLFDENNPKSIDQAYDIEANTPSNWDKEALTELAALSKIWTHR